MNDSIVAPDGADQRELLTLVREAREPAGRPAVRSGDRKPRPVTRLECGGVLDDDHVRTRLERGDGRVREVERDPARELNSGEVDLLVADVLQLDELEFLSIDVELAFAQIRRRRVIVELGDGQVPGRGGNVDVELGGVDRRPCAVPERPARSPGWCGQGDRRILARLIRRVHCR